MTGDLVGGAKKGPLLQNKKRLQISPLNIGRQHLPP